MLQQLLQQPTLLLPPKRCKFKVMISFEKVKKDVAWLWYIFFKTLTLQGYKYYFDFIWMNWVKINVI